MLAIKFFSPWIGTLGSQSWQKVNSMIYRLDFRVYRWYTLQKWRSKSIYLIELSEVVAWPCSASVGIYSHIGIVFSKGLQDGCMCSLVLCLVLWSGRGAIMYLSCCA